MHKFRWKRHIATYYPDFEIMPQAVAQLPWGHISLLIHKVKDDTTRCWYAEQCIEQGWSRLILERYVKDNLYQRQAISSKKTSNYLTRLPSPQSRLAQELLKQPYNFDFLGLHDEAHEREIEHAFRFNTLPSLCWNWVKALLLSGHKYLSQSKMTNFSSTCFFIICIYVVSL